MRTGKIFIGYDARQPVAYNVCQFSVLRNASHPVSITPLVFEQLPIKKQALTPFTYSRFLVPWLCDYEGVAVFLDPDIVVTGDICELFQYSDCAVSVMKKQKRFEWPSVMVFRNELCKRLTPEYIDNEDVLQLMWGGEIGSLPQEWNLPVGYSDRTEAKLYHYTQGIPFWNETRGFHDEPWQDYYVRANSAEPWASIMGNSVHAEPVRNRLNGDHH